MTSYKVVWDIEVDADSPREAAKKAQEIQRDPTSWATYYKVRVEGEEMRGGYVLVDLMEEEEGEKHA